MSEKKERLPVDAWMPFFVNDETGSAATFVMNNRQYGAFTRLRCHAWKQQASLPNDLRLIAKYADEAGEWFETEEGRAVLDQFPIGDDGRRRNAVLSAHFNRATQLREERAESARKAAEKRWGRGDDTGGQPADSAGNADAYRPVSPQPSSTASPSPSSKKAGVEAALSASLERCPLVVAWVGDDANRKILLADGADRVAAEADARAIHGFVSVLSTTLQEHSPQVVEQGLTDWLARFKSFTPNSFRIAVASAARTSRTVAEIGAPKSKPTTSTRQAENPARPTKLSLA